MGGSRLVRLGSWTRAVRRRSHADRMLALQSLVLLGLARAIILAVPFRHLAGRIGVHQAETLHAVDDASLEMASRVRWAVTTASRYTPWTSNCFPRALAAKFLLHRRGIDSTLYLGATISGPADLKGHAWLRCGTCYVTGGRGHETYGVLGIFGPVVGGGSRRPRQGVVS